jgi:hypothetical protein
VRLSTLGLDDLDRRSQSHLTAPLAAPLPLRRRRCPYNKRAVFTNKQVKATVFKNSGKLASIFFFNFQNSKLFFTGEREF